ncbi:MAG: hypothetical protein H0W71_08790 [Sphingomonas sp.]|nr:hypothetical protein [Sphingomonas sp.]
MRIEYYRLAGAAGMIGAAVLLTGCGAGLSAQATVTTIDRTCVIVETIRSEEDDPRVSGHKLRVEQKDTRSADCKSVGEWEKVRAKRTKDVDGKAVVHVDYKAPKDGSYHSSTLTYTGRDDEFYSLKAGDKIDILVSEDDPARIRKG